MEDVRRIFKRTVARIFSAVQFLGIPILFHLSTMVTHNSEAGTDLPYSSNSSDNEKGNETDQSRPDDTSPTPPPFEFDDPKGWIAVAAAACSLFCYLGVIYSWGIMQVRLVEVTGTSLTTLTFVGSLATSFMISLSILSGLAVRKIGYQKTALAGGILMGLGEFLASWTTKHIGALFIFHGVIFGIGGGLSIFVSSYILGSANLYLAYTQSGLLNRTTEMVQATQRISDGYCVRRRKSWSSHHEYRNKSSRTTGGCSLDIPHPRLHAVGCLHTGVVLHPATFWSSKRRVKAPMVCQYLLLPSPCSAANCLSQVSV